MRLRKIFPLALAFTLLCGCLLRSASAEEAGLYVYRLAAGGSGSAALCAQSVTPDPGESETDCLVRSLNSEPGGETLRRVFPEGVRLLSCRVENGRALADMSPEYGALTGVEKTLCELAAVCTLYRLDAVTAVDISCAGIPVQTGLRADSAELADAQYAPGERLIKLFVPDADGEYLVSRSFVDASGASAPEAAANALLRALPEVPDAASLVSVSVSEGVCALDLSEEFYTTEPESVHASRLVIGSFVNTLCFLPEVERVVIQVGGTPIGSYGSWITVWPAGPDWSLISYDGG